MSCVSNLRRAAFTLAELLVVIGIIVLLIGLLLPTLSAARASAQRTACAATLYTIGQSMAAYAAQNEGYPFPAITTPDPLRSDTWAEPVLGDLGTVDRDGNKTSDFLVCPSDPFGGSPLAHVDTKNSYLLNNLIYLMNVAPGSQYRGASPSDIVVLGEKRPDAVGWYLHGAWSTTSTETDWTVQIDLVRHGRRLRSNHLFYDLHVDNSELKWPSGISSPWNFEVPTR